MSMGRRERECQSEMWVATDRVARSPGHPFYTRLYWSSDSKRFVYAP